MTTLRFMLDVVATENLDLIQLDVKTKFLHGDLNWPNQLTRHCRIFSGKSSMKIERIGTQCCRVRYGPIEQPTRQVYAQPHSG